ncbi:MULTISPECIES: hypothetical protein [unclassified Streptomyces]|uniref:hypothetical protein n=1 Tax=unclassified Streptomyces TaxID=2593676 RepID=UPI002DDC3E5F|nr:MULTISPECIES: hypothetical protein [unclassified Streptomyces]
MVVIPYRFRVLAVAGPMPGSVARGHARRNATTDGGVVVRDDGEVGEPGAAVEQRICRRWAHERERRGGAPSYEVLLERLLEDAVTAGNRQPAVGDIERAESLASGFERRYQALGAHLSAAQPRRRIEDVRPGTGTAGAVEARYEAHAVKADVKDRDPLGRLWVIQC